jgi:peptidoglycan hydrolase-like protein with peptidoglycan-binding domain
MRKFIRKCALGIASVLALSIAGAALDYAADPGNAVADPANVVTAGSTPAVSHTSESWRSGAFIRKDDIRWAQLELRFRGLYKGSLDGVLGPETRRALAQFQKNNDLGQTASLDAQTWEALTGNPDIGQGSSVPPNSDRAGTTTDSSIASHLGN